MFGRKRFVSGLVTEILFTVTLPGKWQRTQKGSSFFGYRSVETAESLSVSLMFFEPVHDPLEANQLFDRVIELRRQSEVDVAEGPGLVLTQVAYGHEANGPTASFEGFEENSGRRTKTLMIGRDRMVAVFYYEEIEPTQRQSSDSRPSILDSVALRV